MAAEWRQENPRLGTVGCVAIDARGEPTVRFETFRDLDLMRPSPESFSAERERMIAICAGCHSAGFARTELARGDTMVRESDRMLAEAIRIVAGLYADGVLTQPAGSAAPMPDLMNVREAPAPIERRLYEMYLEHRTRAVQGTFHQSPDHSLWQGWSELVRDLEDIRSMATSLRRRQDASR